MKKTLTFILSFIVFIQLVNAQFDDRFYFPSKEYSVDQNPMHEDILYEIDTVKIHSLWLKQKNETKFTVLFFMGASGNASNYLPLANLLLSTGAQIFIFEPRGYGLSTGTPSHLNIASDAQFVLDNLIKLKEVQNTKIIVYGASLGSQIASHITKNNQDIISALIIDGGMSSFTDIALEKTPEERKSIVKKFVTSPYSSKEDLEKIKDIPKLIIHGTEDETIPFSHAEINYNNAKEPKELWSYQGGHLQVARIDREAYIQKIVGVFYSIK